MPRPYSRVVAEVHRLERVERAARKLLLSIDPRAVEAAYRDGGNELEWHQIRQRPLVELYEAIHEDMERQAGTYQRPKFPPRLPG